MSEKKNAQEDVANKFTKASKEYAKLLGLFTDLTPLLYIGFNNIIELPKDLSNNLLVLEEKIYRENKAITQRIDKLWTNISDNEREKLMQEIAQYAKNLKEHKENTINAFKNVIEELKKISKSSSDTDKKQLEESRDKLQNMIESLKTDEPASKPLVTYFIKQATGHQNDGSNVEKEHKKDEKKHKDDSPGRFST